MLKKQINIHHIIQFLCKLLCRNKSTGYSLSVIGNFINKTGRLYKMIGYKQNENTSYYIQFLIQLNSQHLIRQDDLIQQLTKIIFSSGYATQITNITKKLHQYNKNVVDYLKQYRHQIKHRLIIMDGFIDTCGLQKYKNTITSIEPNLQTQLFVKMYNQFYKDHKDKDFYYTIHPQDIQSALRIMQYIKSLSQTQFTEQFGFETSKQIELFFRCFNDIRVNSYDLLKGKLSIRNTIDTLCINLVFTEKFKFQNIEEQFLCNLFQGSEKRLQHIQLDYKLALFKKKDFNNIQKREITFTNKSNIEQFLALLNDGQTYQALIRGQEYTNFNGIMISYLNYINQNDCNDINIQLKYPNALISATLENVQLDNLGMCINLQNLCTVNHRFTLKQLQPLVSLKRFKSKNDNYESTKLSMVQQLFKTNKLEYIFIEYGVNIVNGLIMNENTQNLRFFYHLSIEQVPISIDVTIFPERLQFLYNFFNDDGYTKEMSEVQITGNQTNIYKLNRQLISQ